MVDTRWFGKFRVEEITHGSVRSRTGGRGGGLLAQYRSRLAEQ